LGTTGTDKPCKLYNARGATACVWTTDANFDTYTRSDYSWPSITAATCTHLPASNFNPTNTAACAGLSGATNCAANALCYYTDGNLVQAGLDCTSSTGSNYEAESTSTSHT
jgi:hypothetical protein